MGTGASDPFCFDEFIEPEVTAVTVSETALLSATSFEVFAFLILFT